MHSILHYFSQWFDFPKQALFCQIANRSASKIHLRTMRLYKASVTGELEFLSRTDTQKWVDWQKDPSVAICFFHQDLGQILVEGTVVLKTSKTNVKELQVSWEELPEFVKKIYMDKGVIPSPAVPNCFGSITVIPFLWEVLELSKEDYLKSTRTLYQVTTQGWLKQDIAITS